MLMLTIAVAKCYCNHVLQLHTGIQHSGKYRKVIWKGSHPGLLLSGWVKVIQCTVTSLHTALISTPAAHVHCSLDLALAGCLMYAVCCTAKEIEHR